MRNPATAASMTRISTPAKVAPPAKIRPPCRRPAGRLVSLSTHRDGIDSRRDLGAQLIRDRRRTGRVGGCLLAFWAGDVGYVRPDQFAGTGVVVVAADDEVRNEHDRICPGLRRI